MSNYKPSGSSRLDITGQDIQEVTKRIAYNQPQLKWLHASNALKLAQDPYINELITRSLKWVKAVYLATDPQGNQVGQQWMNQVFKQRLGHNVEPEDLPTIAAWLYQYLEKRITSLRVIEMVRYLSSADPSEKLITGSIITEATEASEKVQEKTPTPKAPKPLEQDLEEIRANHPAIYHILLEDTKQQLEKIQRMESGTPKPHSPSPVVGEKEIESEASQN